MHRLCLIAGLLSLAACASTGPATRRNPHTGIVTHTSGMVVLDRGLQYTFDVQVAYQHAGGPGRWVLLTAVSRTDRNYPAIVAAWSQRQRLPYRKIDRRFAGCPSGTCSRQEVGVIPLTPDLVRIFARTGLTLQLQGKRGSYAGHIPAQAFASVLARSAGG